MKLLFTLIFLLSVGFFIAQEETHFCAQKFMNSEKPTHEKYLSVQQEEKANLYDVTGYFLDLNMTNQNSTISGTARIYGKTQTSLDSLILELHPNFSITDLKLNGINTTYQRYNTVLAVAANAVGSQNFEMEITYNGTSPPISSNPVGVSGVYNQNVSIMNDKITFTISTPFYAHQWFPVKQVLRDKADSSRVYLTVPSNCKAASNGVLQNTVDNGNGTTRFEWFNCHPIGYNLIFAAIAPFLEYNGQAFPSQLGGAPVQIQNYLYGAGSTLLNMQTQCDLIPGFLELFSDLYGLYPFADQRYGVLAAPFGGGMEHQTMPTIGTWEKKVTAHELSHMWWGDKVGFRSFSDIWLSEGFATYSEFLMLENNYPSEAQPLLLSWHTNVKSSNSGSVYHVDTFNLTRIYNSRLSYRKAASILHTLRGTINNDVLFFQALADYYNIYKDSVASSADFISSVEATTNLDLTEFANQWLYGEGFPQYNVRWNNVGSDLLVEISHTASLPSVTPLFTNFLELKFSRSTGSDTTIRFDINSNQDQFFVMSVGSITDVVAIDPNNWIINNNGTITMDPLFLSNDNTLDMRNRIKLHPNPTNGDIHFSTPNNEELFLTITDLRGRIHAENIPVKSTLNLSFLDEGSYIFKLTNASNGHTNQINVVKF